jgi:hypothetical protein
MMHKNGQYIWIKSVGVVEGDIFYGFHLNISDLVDTKEMLPAQ